MFEAGQQFAEQEERKYNQNKPFQRSYPHQRRYLAQQQSPLRKLVSAM